MKKTNKLMILVSSITIISFSGMNAAFFELDKKTQAPTEQKGFLANLFGQAQQQPQTEAVVAGVETPAYTNFVNSIQQIIQKSQEKAIKLQKQLMAMNPQEKIKAMDKMQKQAMQNMQHAFSQLKAQNPAAAKAMETTMSGIASKIGQRLQNLMQQGQQAQQAQTVAQQVKRAVSGFSPFGRSARFIR